MTCIAYSSIVGRERERESECDWIVRLHGARAAATPNGNWIKCELMPNDQSVPSTIEFKQINECSSTTFHACRRTMIAFAYFLYPKRKKHVKSNYSVSNTPFCESISAAPIQCEYSTCIKRKYEIMCQVLNATISPSMARIQLNFNMNKSGRHRNACHDEMHSNTDCEKQTPPQKRQWHHSLWFSLNAEVADDNDYKCSFRILLYHSSGERPSDRAKWEFSFHFIHISFLNEAKRSMKI